MVVKRRRKKNIAFVHPDLGLGGAERLVVDAASALSENGHQVHVYTAFHDSARCFIETTDGSFTVTVCGSWFPRSIFGGLHALCAYVRCCLVAIRIAWTAYRRKQQYDVVFADQVSAVIPVLHLLTNSKVIFYCHHPDLLLTHRSSRLQRAYRLPLDWIEEHTTGQADKVLVNSRYTAEVFAATFKRLNSRGLSLEVLHPSCHVPSIKDLAEAERHWRSRLPQDLVCFLENKSVFVSINRFERKKDIGLAVQAFFELLESSPQAAENCRLVLAGGYDKRLSENREYFLELQDLVSSAGLQDKVWMLPSFSDQQKAALLAASLALLYTPANEHFGIVPLEAMAASKPVVACNSGGPMETVLHCQTGFLCEPQPHSFAAAMKQLLVSEENCKLLGENARRHVFANFTKAAFGSKLQAIIYDMTVSS